MEVEEEVVKVVKLKLDDGIVVDLPLTLLPFFQTLYAMVEDIGGGMVDMEIPVANITASDLKWLITLYDEYVHWAGLYTRFMVGTGAGKGEKEFDLFHPSIKAVTHFDTTGKTMREHIAKMRLVQLLRIYNFLHFNESIPAEMYVQIVLFERLMDEKEPLGIMKLIAIEDVPFWAPHKPIVEYVLQCLPYARRYREVLSFLRESAPDVTPTLLEELPRPTLTPIVCVSDHTLVITPSGLFVCGRDNDGQLGVGRVSNRRNSPLRS